MVTQNISVRTDEQALADQIERAVNAADAGDFASDNEVDTAFQGFENSMK